MSGFCRLATQLYSLLIRLYPVSFRKEFGAEMTAVFTETLNEAARVGKRSLLFSFLRELRDYPFSLLRQHWRKFRHLEPNLMTTIKKPEWPFFPAWVILTALCFPISFILSLIILFTIERIVGGFIYVDGVRHVTQDYLSTYVNVPIVSLLTGGVQYGLLRQYLPRMGWWVLATTGGWFLGFLLIFGWINLGTNESWNVNMALIMLGLSIGMGQWLLLRRRLPRAGLWIGANVVGWGWWPL